MAYNHRLPTSEEITEDTICYPLYLPDSDYFREILLGALRESILADRHYQRDDELTALTVRDYYRNVTYLPLVQAMIDETPCSTPPELGKEPGQCFEYSPRAPFIKWVNYDPFTNNDPIPLFRDFPIDIVPDFIAIPPWITYTGPIGETIAKVIDFFKLFGGQEISLAALVGYQFGDVFTTLAQADVALKNEEGQFKLPGFDIEVSGAGVVEIELLAVPFGGLAYVALDENNADPQSLLDVAELFISGADPDEETVDVNRDITQLPQESAESTITEIEITEPGDHTIYVRFLPAFNDSITPLGFGGGLRRVGLCGAIVPRGEDYDGEKITEENIVTTPTELEQSLYNALKRRDCDCCGGDSAGGDGTGGGGVDENNDGIDDETGELIATQQETRSGESKSLARNWIGFADFIMRLDANNLSISSMESLIDLEYDVSNAIAVANQVSLADAAEEATGDDLPARASSFFGAPGSIARTNLTNTLAQSIFCEGDSRNEFGQFARSRFQSSAATEATLELLKLIKASPTDEQLAVWESQGVINADYLGYDCTIRPSWSYTLTSAEYWAGGEILIGTQWQQFTQSGRRVAITATGSFVGTNGDGDQVIRDFFYTSTTDNQGTEVLSRVNFGSLFLEGTASTGTDDSAILYPSGISYARNHVYRQFCQMQRNTGGEWTLSPNPPQNIFVAEPTGSITIAVRDLGDYA